MFLKGVWLIIAGVLLLGHTSVLAESYLRVRKKGVTYYYFSDRGAPASRQGGMKTAARGNVYPPPPIRLTFGQGEALIQGPTPPPDLPETLAESQVVQPPEAKVQIWAGARHLLGLLTKLGYHSPLALPACQPGLGRLEGRQNLPAIQEPVALAALRGENFRKYAREPRPEWGQVQPAEPGSSQLPYCFPVSGPYSFRDSWNDYRSGGRLHRAADIFAREGTPVYAITAGVIHTVASFNGAGLTILMQGQDGRGYGYMHLQGFAAGIVEGRAVRTGELIGYVGRSGLYTSPAHLHFQVYADHRLGRDNLLNPYSLLVQLCQGIGVTDLDQHRLAYLPEPQIRTNHIQVYRRRIPTFQLDGRGQRLVKTSPVLVIRNN